MGYSAKCRTDNLSCLSKSISEENTPGKRAFDIKAVEEFIEINVIRDQKTVSMRQLQEIYGDKLQDR